MQKPLTFLASAAFSVILALPVVAQDTPNRDTVVATVNGTDITLGHMIVARASLPEQYQQLPDEVLFAGILDQLVQQTALADSFEGDLPARAVLSLDNETRSLTAAEVLEKVMSAPLDETTVLNAYEEQYAGQDAGDEYNASHILVETQEEANAIKEELANGADFAEMARERSTGPSGPGGGSLGWFGKGMMVPSFEEAVVALAPGAVSDPVETQFGWHVIKLNETRKTQAPALEEVREELELQLRQILAQTTIEDITAAASVDRSGSEGIDPSLLKNLDWLE
ncbi:MAG: peptidylprolyl isomerase [Sulfitobacter sp.]|jgi:peptidyl-prolyl cis-trans isomerase C|nr:peptidylprolyl isomerase [Sulfitobacter sp.]